MIAGGSGGANTITGKYFEIETNLELALKEAGYDLKDFTFCGQYTFETYVKEHANLNMKKIFGKAYRPDEAVIYNDILYIVEKKHQGGGGSTDEKIQSGPYKLLVYQECARALGLKGVKYIYLLRGAYFNQPKFTTHQIPYLARLGIPTYFDKLNLEEVFNERIDR